MSAQIMQFRRPYNARLLAALNAVALILEEPMPVREYIQYSTNIIEDLFYALLAVPVPELKNNAAPIIGVIELAADIGQHIVNETRNPGGHDAANINGQ